MSASTLTITFNNANGFDLTQSGFTETVPANLSIQTSPAPTTTCSGASGTLSTSTSTVTMAGADIPAKGSCTITVSVKSATAGDYANDIAANALIDRAGRRQLGECFGLADRDGSCCRCAAKSGGGGELDWWDMMFVAGVLLAGRRRAVRPPR